MADGALLHEPADEAGAQACELRVLAGRTAGASAPIARGRWIEIGHAFSNDVVLRDPGARGVRLRLRAGEGSAELDLIEGSVEVLGHTATGPSTALLPEYVPLLMGESAVAFGDPASPRWAEAERLLRASRPDSTPADHPIRDSDAGPPTPWKVISPAAAALPKLAPLLPIVGGALAAVIVALVAWSLVARLLSAAPTPDAATAALRSDGFHGVTAVAGQDGLVIQGVLPHQRDVMRLQADVARRRWPAAVQVRSNDALAQTVADVMRTNGFDADVKAIGPGILAVAVKGGDATQIDILRRRLLHDTPGLKQLVVNGGGGGGLLADDPNKKVVSVVGGDEGYVETADGSRYFVGAVLPTGHTITSIDGQTVRVEKDGRTTELQF